MPESMVSMSGGRRILRLVALVVLQIQRKASALRRGVNGLERTETAEAHCADSVFFVLWIVWKVETGVL
jgi:hypothetical protein